jgi:hypothetical protein
MPTAPTCLNSTGRRGRGAVQFTPSVFAPVSPKSLRWRQIFAPGEGSCSQGVLGIAKRFVLQQDFFVVTFFSHLTQKLLFILNKLVFFAHFLSNTMQGLGKHGMSRVRHIFPTRLSTDSVDSWIVAESRRNSIESDTIRIGSITVGRSLGRPAGSTPKTVNED